MIAEWVVVGGIILIAIFLVKMGDNMQKYKTITIILLALFLYLSVSGILSSGEIDITSPKSIMSGIYLSVGWIGQSASTLWDVSGETFTMVGNVIKENKTEEERPRR